MDKILETLKKELEKLEKTTKKKKSTLLQAVVLKGEGFGFYLSPQTREFIRVQKKSEMYLFPHKDVEEGKKYIFIPKDKKGILIEVPEEEIEIIGFN